MLIDTTLREGAQQFGTYLRPGVRKAIVWGLVEAGADEIELGWAGQEGLADLAAWSGPRQGSTVFSVWSACRVRDVEASTVLGLERINIGVPVSDDHIRLRFGLDRTGLMEMAAQAIGAAKRCGVPYVSLGLEDVSRADPEFALAVARTASDLGVSRIRLSDTVGRLSPLRMAELVRAFGRGLAKKTGPRVHLAVHCHNDFGMATANALSALQAGADFADASLLGMGERAGIAATEELLAYLCMVEGRGKYALDGLRALCRETAEAAGLQVPRFKAIAGQDIFACETGLHTHAIRKSPDLFEAYAPESLGACRVLGLGGKSGRAAVLAALDDNNLRCPDARVAELVGAVRTRSWELGRPLSNSEFLELAAGRAEN